jgi:hypothetical protein
MFWKMEKGSGRIVGHSETIVGTQVLSPGQSRYWK